MTTLHQVWNVVVLVAMTIAVGVIFGTVLAVIQFSLDHGKEIAQRRRAHVVLFQRRAQR